MKVNIEKYPDDDSERKVEIKLDPFDTWSLDHTLALIIHPLLIQLKDTTHGGPEVDLEDVPEDLVGEENYFRRWDYVLDEMIWAFGELKKDDWSHSFNKEYEERINNATRLFGKYYRALWD